MSQESERDEVSRTLHGASWRDDRGVEVLNLSTAIGRIVPFLIRAQVRAWDRGYRSGKSIAMRRMSDEPGAADYPNPIRRQLDEHDEEVP